MRHVLSAKQFTPESLSEIFQEADDMRELLSDRESRQDLAGRHVGSMLATLFYEPSTRTRLSFESAAQRLGLGILSTENAGEFSSAVKGETIEDTVQVLDGYADIVVLRHKEVGSADRAASVSGVPIINAGDGNGEHPTQALLDLYTIKREKERLSGLNVVIGGDLLGGRTARSLAQMLALYDDNHISFVSVPELQIGDEVRLFLEDKGVSYTVTEDMFEAIHVADVVYWTRIQRERLEALGINPNIEDQFVIDQAALQVIPEQAIIMHPLPRTDEIHPNVDHDPRAAYFRQTENGLYIRMALIDTLLK